MLKKFGTEKPSTWTAKFVLDTPKLTRLCAEITSRFAHVGATAVFNFTVGFRDKRRERRSSVEEVINLENTRSNPVNALSVQATGTTTDSKSLSCSVEFSNAQKDNVRLAVRGADPIITNDIHAALDERVEATFEKNWGQLVALLALLLIFVSALFVVARLPGGPGVFGDRLSQKDYAELNDLAEHASTDAAKLDFIFELHRREIQNVVGSTVPINVAQWMTASAVATLILLVCVTVLLAYLVLVCYPRAVFEWGEYGEYFENLKSRRKYIRNLVIVGVLVGLVVSVAATGFSGQFHRNP
ncbi:MAG TPA: hypothetical protein VNY07_11810 [Chthoniobacterales bacterium]|jgi:hypothetical protein|nr:hypothetical protein [Chthoniobacterales bacterium]